MDAGHQVRVRGPLEPHADGGRAALATLGYAPGTVENHMRVLAHLSQWMAAEGIPPSALSQPQVERFLVVLRTQWQRPPTGRTLAPLLGWLRDQQVVPPLARPTSATPIDVLVGRYRVWLVEERGVSPATLRGYAATARRFLTACSTAVVDLRGADVTAFLLAECAHLTVDSAKGVVTALRSLLRFLYLMELTPLPLASAVPPVAGWRETRLPATLTPTDVQALLASCDRTHPTGQRDFAILTLLARLGLRAAEVAGLRLEGVDWRAGELVVRGKGRRVDRLPLLGEVGEALAAYLADGRPRTTCRALFVTHTAPVRALHPTTVSGVVRAACVRVQRSPIGAHRLRHTLASTLLRQGATLPEIGQVLRHQHLSSTAVYAKVDRIALRTLARPWPEMAQ